MIMKNNFFHHYFHQLPSYSAASKFAFNAIHTLENLYNLRLFLRGLSRQIGGSLLFNCNNCLVKDSCVTKVDQRFYFFTT